jgi:hypothetical protein
VLIQVSPPTKEELAQHPPDRCPLIVRVFPEPRLRWHLLTEVVSAKATDEQGGAILPALALPVTTPEQDRDWGRKTRTIATGFNDAATRGVLAMSAEPTAPTEVATLKGIVRFTAWKPTGVLATVKLADGETSGTADGPHGTQLTVKVIGPVANETGSTTLELTHRWDPELVRLDQPGLDTGEGVWLQSVNGRAALVHANDPVARGPNQWGLAVSNRAGELVFTTAGGPRIDDTTHLGRRLTTMTATYVARPGKLNDARPAAVSFHGARVVEAAVPFAVKELPLAVGTGTFPETRRRTKW